MRDRPLHKHTSEPTTVGKPSKQKTTIILRRLSRNLPLSAGNPSLAKKISQMRLHIAPIVHVETGLPAPDFPHTMLHLFTLTEAQLDRIAKYYSQTTPCALTYQYPLTMDWCKDFLNTDPSLPKECKLDDLERLKVKMRMFARFVGMRGADTPCWEVERQVQIMRNKIRRSIGEEESRCRKGVWGPGYVP